MPRGSESGPVLDPEVAAGMTARSGYGVKLVRGPFLRLARHPDHCDNIRQLRLLVDRLRAEDPDAMISADLFSGAGGLSLGLRSAGFTTVFSADHYTEAVETHAHHFPGMSVDWDLADPDTIKRVGTLLQELDIDLLAGGPPCQPFSKAGRSIIRHRVQLGLREPHDERRDLWRSYLEIVRLARPRAVLMENVPDMALDKEMFILRAVTEDLEQAGYSVAERVMETWRWGVPQFRQRLIVVAVRDGIRFDWPEEAPERVTVWGAIGDLPEVEGGWRPDGGADGWADYEGPQTAFQRRMRTDVDPDDEKRVFDHITRPVREDDLRAFNLMDSTTRYSDLPDDVKRYRDDIFDDKYKRLDENDFSRTITAHIARDGYWYIHPRQPRTITVREAARIQTFPDDFRFAGPPSAAFKQIGNAVPPLLAEQLGARIREALVGPGETETPSRITASRLASWFDRRTSLRVPWLRASSRWQAVAGDLVLDRAEQDHIRVLWPMLESFASPEDLADQDEPLRQIGELIGRGQRVTTLLELTDWLIEHPGALDEPEPHAIVPGLGEAVADLAVLVAPPQGDVESGDAASAEEPVLVTKGVLRVAGRYFDEPVERRNRLTDGRIAVARLIGGSKDARRAHLGLIELANSLCRPVHPLCVECPLNDGCVSSTAAAESEHALF